MPNTRHEPIAILGAGSWGTALALHLSRLGQPVLLWAKESSYISKLQSERMNSHYLPGFLFPETLSLTADLPAAVSQAKDIFIAVPSVGFRDLLMALKPLLSSPARIIWGTKGLDFATQQLLHEVAHATLGSQHQYAILSGPSFAREVAAGLPTAVVIASQNAAYAQELMQRFNSSSFRVYSSSDVIGVEIGGVVKNIMAIATGISDGMQFGANARSALITRGLAEMIRLGTSLGGQYETFIGLTGLGDLVLTCTDNQSRNRRFGLALGQTISAPAAEKEIGQVVEGKRNAELIIQLAQKQGIEMPIAEAVWEILQGKLSPRAAMEQLLARKTKAEN